MSDPIVPAVTRQKVEAEGRSRKGTVTGKLRVALDAMIWGGMTRKEGAERAGLADASIRFAMRKGHVLAYYNGELAALRTSLRAKTVHRFARIADDSSREEISPSVTPRAARP